MPIRAAKVGISYSDTGPYINKPIRWQAAELRFHYCLRRLEIKQLGRDSFLVIAANVGLTVTNPYRNPYIRVRQGQSLYQLFMRLPRKHSSLSNKNR